jgi:putative transposase
VGKKTGRNPTDRGKRGVKRSLLVDGCGIPLSVVVAGANTNDHKLMRQTLEAIATARPEPSPEAPQNLCLDKGYDYDEPRALAREFAFTLHLRTRGEEMRERVRQAGAKARRWVVERTHSWLNRFRRILIRWEKKPENYLAMLHAPLCPGHYHVAKHSPTEIGPKEIRLGRNPAQDKTSSVQTEEPQ